MDERMPLFYKCRDTVLSQGGDFEWVICMDPRTPEMYLRRIVTDPRIIIANIHPMAYFMDKKIEEPWLITTRLDNDDLYEPGAVRAIQNCFTEQEIIIDLVYEQYELRTRKKSSSKRYNPNSPFLSLIEKTDKEIKTCYARPHHKMSQDWPVGIYASRQVLAYMVIHENNIGNKILE